MLVSRGMLPKATTKDIPKDIFLHWPGALFAAMVLVPSYSLVWRSPVPHWRQHSWLWPHTALAMVLCSDEWSGATTTGRAGLSEPEATLFGKRQSTSSVCLGCHAQTHTWPLFLLSQRESDQSLASSPMGWNSLSPTSAVQVGWCLNGSVCTKQNTKLHWAQVEGFSCAPCLLRVWKQHKFLFCFII